LEVVDEDKKDASFEKELEQEEKDVVNEIAEKNEFLGKDPGENSNFNSENDTFIRKLESSSVQ